MSEHMKWKWRATDARNIKIEECWIAIPSEDFWRLREGLGDIPPEAVKPLLEALKEVLGVLEDGALPVMNERRARAAITRAEGEGR